MDEIVVRDRHIEALEARIAELEDEIEQFKIKYNVDIASTDLHYQDRIAELEATLAEERAGPGRLQVDATVKEYIRQFLDKAKREARQQLHSEGKI